MNEKDAVQELHGIVSTLGYFFRNNLPHENATGEFHSSNQNLSADTRTQLAIIEDSFKQADDVFRKVFGLPHPKPNVRIGTSPLTPQSDSVKTAMEETPDSFL